MASLYTVVVFLVKSWGTKVVYEVMSKASVKQTIQRHAGQHFFPKKKELP